MKCAACRFHRSHSVNEHTGDNYGVCVRYPPNAYAKDSSALPPVMTDKSWCGEFKHRNWLLRLLRIGQ